MDVGAILSAGGSLAIFGGLMAVVAVVALIVLVVTGGWRYSMFAVGAGILGLLVLLVTQVTEYFPCTNCLAAGRSGFMEWHKVDVSAFDVYDADAGRDTGYVQRCNTCGATR